MLIRRLNRLGEDALRQLIEVQRADALGKGTQPPEEIEARTASLREALDALLAQKPCFTLKQLSIRGNDLPSAGVPAGKAVGQCLQRLLEEVMAGDIPNEREALLSRAREIAQHL